MRPQSNTVKHEKKKKNVTVTKYVFMVEFIIYLLAA